MHFRLPIAVAFLTASAAGQSKAQQPDSSLLAEIMSIRAVDTHAHPMGVQSNDSADEFTPPPSVPPLGPPELLRATNPAWREASLALFGPLLSDEAPGAAKRRAQAQYGAEYPAWILEKLNIETMLANRHSISPGLAAPRFRLVWFADPLVFPLDNSKAKAQNPQAADVFSTEERWLRAYMRDAKLSQLPATLGGYLNRFVSQQLQARKREGAVAVKLSLAYERDLEILESPEADAQRIYAAHAGTKNVPSRNDYRLLQDFIIRDVIVQAGKLKMPVQIHVGAGSGPFFDNRGADPFLLMPLLLDPRLRQTTIVLVHGGFPDAAATRVLFAKPNVYVDFSSQAFLSSTRELSEVLRKWLEFRPEKVMFGTDAYPVSSEAGWEELAWITNASSRRALAIALTGMIRDGEITRERASTIARMVMRETAISVYGLDR